VRARVLTSSSSSRRHRYQLAQQQRAAERINGALGQAQAQGQGPNVQGQGLGLNIPLAPGLQTPQSMPAQQLPPAQHPPQPQPQQPQQQQQQQQQARKEPERPRTVWRGPISWALTEVSGTTAEYTMFCTAVPMQQSAIRDLCVDLSLARPTSRRACS